MLKETKTKKRRSPNRGSSFIFWGDTMNQLAIQKIMECLEENLFEPNRQWPQTVFEERSYARWAAFEIWQRLMDRPHDLPDDIIEEFALKTQALSAVTDDPVKARIFSIASDTAEDILTLF